MKIHRIRLDNIVAAYLQKRHFGISLLASFLVLLASKMEMLDQQKVIVDRAVQDLSLDQRSDLSLSLLL
jgi:hypothetical protein